MRTFFLLAVIAALVCVSYADDLCGGNPNSCTQNVRGGGRCAGHSVRWTEKKGYHQVNIDVDVKRGLTPDQCRQACFDNPACESTDFVNGECYLNADNTNLVQNAQLTMFQFECCPDCSSAVRSSGRCAGDRVRWTEMKGYHEVSVDVDVKGNLDENQCRQACLDNPACESADFKDRVCYLNAHSTNLVAEADQSLKLFLFECCSEGCSSSVRKDGRCAGRRVHFTEKKGYHQVNIDVDVKHGLSADQCRQACLDNSRCESTDFVNGDCYLNADNTNLQQDSRLTMFQFDCCAADCSSDVRKGGRCAGRRVSWTEKKGYHQVNIDVDVKHGLSADQCRQACLDNPRCESTDFVNGDCYLNADNTNLQQDLRLTMFQFECCA